MNRRAFLGLLMAGGLPEFNYNFMSNYSGPRLNLFVLAGSPTTPLQATFTIKSGVIVGSTDNTVTMETGIWPVGSAVKLVIESGAYLTGKGGNGGGWNGREDSFGTPQNMTIAATNGSSALLVQNTISIENNGTIQSGGNGGAFDYRNEGGYVRNIAGGGGGAGFPVGMGGASLFIENNDGYMIFHTYPPYAIDGANGTISTAGERGQSRYPDGWGGWSYIYGIVGGGAGTTGYCVSGNSYVTWLTTGTRLGSIIS